jgi:hypothetical protein
MCENYPKPYVVGKAVLEADIKKNKKHSEACEKAGYGFQAFASDTSGVLSPDYVLDDLMLMNFHYVLDVSVLLFREG